MITPLRIWMGGRELLPRELELALLRPCRRGRLEIEIGFGKGRYLLARAAAEPDTTFVGIESAALYWGATTRRAERGGLGNLITVCGDALYLLAARFERESADAVHVYFPDPWPKTRHHRRRLLDPSTVDLVVGVLAPGGTLYFATDHADYCTAVCEVLDRYPAVAVERVEGPWPGGPRTHYETKYEREGRPIFRLVVTRLAPARASLLHPDGAASVAAGSLERAVD
ncbi:MAG TPA: tRNA (guanosine(46)-N7)-methyltransferase TrmB [Thermoanaerobaculia bacterium]|nr:tRNA (guanosine(46)-N7)-methyltransferase TrmB [Thermoanaerobaculia bacterium]